MALSVFQGTFTMNLTTGNQSITGVGFAPKLVIFTGVTRTAAGQNVHAKFHYGAMVASGQGCAWVRDENASTTSDATRAWSNTHCIYLQSTTAGTVDSTAKYVSMDADGFTINIDDAPGTAYVVAFIAYGGTDVNHVTIGTVQIPTATATTTVNNLTHNLTGLILLTAWSTAATNTNANDAEICIGFSDGTNHCAIGLYAKNGEVTRSYAQRYASATHVLGRLRYNAGTPGIDGTSTVKFITNGFILSHDDQYAESNNTNVIYIAINGPQCKVGYTTAATTLIDVAVTGAGFTPKSLLTLGVKSTLVDADNGDAWFNTGMASSATLEYVNSIVIKNNSAADATVKSYSANIVEWTKSDITAALGGQANLKSFDSDGFTITMTNVTDAYAAIIYYMVMGVKKGYPRIAISSAWKEVSGINIVVGGAWKMVPPSKMQLAISSTWKPDTHVPT